MSCPPVEIAPETDTEVQEKRKKQPKYRVILWNDDDHSFEYVIRMMKKLFGYPHLHGRQIAQAVHAHGKVCVAVHPLEVAELKRNQIRSFGADELVEGCVSSMFATIEPIEEDSNDA
ncbi:MAG: ATP-dependent Clp protease adaptor ClpS [Planctomycetia bacterium]|nr:ATP-dependent Clp protease adaptor ClpS [Planctomycetia bacterium]